jgi:hypothetical protein
MLSHISFSPRRNDIDTKRSESGRKSPRPLVVKMTGLGCHSNFGAESPSWVVNGAARRNSLGVRCVPIAEAQSAFFSVSFGEMDQLNTPLTLASCSHRDRCSTAIL